MTQARLLQFAVATLFVCASLQESSSYQLGGGLTVSRFGKGRSIPRKRSSPLSMYIEGSDNYRMTFSLSSPLLASTTSILPAFVVSSNFPTDDPTLLALTSNPLVEAEVFTDAAHLALDFASLFGPATVVLRLVTVIGRILTIASDYVPDHAMFPEEFIFQMAMLFLSGTLLIKSAIPLALSSSTELSYQDRRTFCALFGPVGVKWHQYKTLATMALDWVALEPNQRIAADDQNVEGQNNGHNNCMYWLYSGDAAVLGSNDKVVHNVTRTNGMLGASNAVSGLLGEMQFVQSLENRKSKTGAVMDPPSYPKTTIQAGPNGAKLLRINTKKLSMLMENDEQLAKAIRSLVVRSMQDKLSSFHGA